MRNFRISLTADIADDSRSEKEGLAHGRMKRNGATQGKPKDKRQACKGPKRNLKPARFQWRKAA